MGYEGRRDINKRFDGTNFEVFGLQQDEDEKVTALKAAAADSKVTKKELVEMIENL